MPSPSPAAADAASSSSPSSISPTGPRRRGGAGHARPALRTPKGQVPAVLGGSTELNEASEASLAMYRERAPRYDAELAWFEPLRAQALALLKLQPGQTVLDLGCGTGLSLPALASLVGPDGQVLGLEPCPEMLSRAQARAGDLPQVELVQAPVAGAALGPLQADAALFHFTHDLLQDPEAIGHVLRHLRPGARVVACGLQWAPWWALHSNLYVFGAALLSLSRPEGLDRPWRLLARALPGLQVMPTWGGGIYLAWATVPDPRVEAE